MRNTRREALHTTLAASFALVAGCATPTAPEPTFAEDVAFLSKHTHVVTLGGDPNGPRVAVIPAWQARVITSTATGNDGISHGWINYDLIESGELQPHINAVGGEDRFWLGPEGGQFSIFFRAGDPFDLEHWQTPAAIDTEPYGVTDRTRNHVTFHHEAQLENYSGTTFDVRIQRSVRLVDRAHIANQLGVGLGSTEVVGFETVNTITNAGTTAWSKDGGLLSIWILGMFEPSHETTVVIPYREGSERALGPLVNDTYFGGVPADRVKVRAGNVFFSGDGEYRSKIGLSPQRAKQVIGSWDGAREVLTIVQFDHGQDRGAGYVNSKWEIQEDPYGGDVVNSYNDGPPAPGVEPLGPFYELESSSPARELGRGESLVHVHRTIHLVGPRRDLDDIARSVLGVSLGQIELAFQ